MTLAIFLVGALAKSTVTRLNPRIHPVVAMSFTLMGAYSFGWTPLLYLVPAEILNYHIRANGKSIFGSVLDVTALWRVFTFPVALEGIG